MTAKWIPAFAGMTWGSAGMAWGSAGMAWGSAGMTAAAGKKQEEKAWLRKKSIFGIKLGNLDFLRSFLLLKETIL